MATYTIAKYLPKTASYINSDKIIITRAGHHNYVIKQKILDSNPALIEMSDTQINSFDEEMVNYLKRLDKIN